MADAQSALVDTGPISDFVSTHHDDPNFGSAWVTYDGGYRLHVRSTTADASFASIVDGLVKRVHAPVVRTFGGASRKELESKAQQLGASGVPNAINDEVGLIDVHDPQILVRDTSPLLTARTPAPSISHLWHTREVTYGGGMVGQTGKMFVRLVLHGAVSE